MEIFHNPILVYTKRPTSVILKSLNLIQKDDDHMNNILEARYKSKIKTLFGIIKFKRRYLKRENLYFIQLHIRINQNFVLSVDVFVRIIISLKTARKHLVSLSVLFQAFRPTYIYASRDFSVENAALHLLQTQSNRRKTLSYL